MMTIDAIINKKALASIKIKRLKPKGGGPDSMILQYFPESMQDTYETNWDNKKIAGGSHPIYSWDAGGDRVISFSVVFYRESLKDVPKEIDMKPSPYNFDINAAVGWLRERRKPYYADGIVYPPECLRLIMPSKMNLYNHGLGGSFMDCIMTECSITYNKFFNDGTPKYVTVSLAFTEVVQSLNSIDFEGRDPE